MASETKRRIWCALYMADRWCFSAGLGLPCRMQDPIKPQDLPMDECMFRALTADQTSLPGPWQPGLWAHMITLVDLFGPIQDLNRRAAQGAVDSTEVDRTVERLAGGLASWEELLPPDARMSNPNLSRHQQRGTGGAFLTLHLGYYHCSTLLYFQFLEEAHQQTFSSSCSPSPSATERLRTTTSHHKTYIARCKYHTSSFSALLRKARGRGGGCACVYSTVGQMITVSSSVLLHTLLFGDEHELRAARDDLNANFEALVDLRRYWPSISSKIDRLVAFQNLCLLSTDSKTHKLDGWMVRFLIEHSLPLQERQMHGVGGDNGSNATMTTTTGSDSLSTKAKEFADMGRYTNFNQF